MAIISTEEKLHERIKELTCLYDISMVLLQKRRSLQETLEVISTIMIKAWRFPASAIVEIELGTHYILTEQLPESTIFQQQKIIVFDVKAGFIKVHYRSSAGEEQPFYFLKEEQKLLRKIAGEISTFYENMLHAANELKFRRTIAHSDRLAILGEMTAGIAHELNTPLGNILGYAELISCSTENKQIGKDLEKIINAAIYSREIVKKLMLFSADMPQHMVLANVKTLIEEALSLLETNFKKSGIQIILDADENLSATIDKVQFVQVLLNLLLNAIYAAPFESNIVIRTTVEKKHLILTISDQGSGISEDIKPKIFEPFFTTKPVGEGSGLGLSVVHGIIKSHKGTITALDNQPNGTTFKLAFPLNTQP